MRFNLLCLLLAFFSSIHASSAMMKETPCFLILLVTARHLNYYNGCQLLKTVAKHPSDGTKNSDVGHAWILLKRGDKIIEGGHSGERGFLQLRYFDGVVSLAEQGDPNPISYLWVTQRDGFFQPGSGGFVPTAAAKVDLSLEQYQHILQYIHPLHYDYSNYALTGNQCSTFLTDVAAIAGLKLESEVVIPVEKAIRFGKKTWSLWSDPVYAEMTLSTPDVLEKSLKKAIRERRAEDALGWYKSRMLKRKCLKCRLGSCIETLLLFPQRYKRVQLFNSVRSVSERGYPLQLPSHATPYPHTRLCL